MRGERADQGLADRTATNPWFLGISDKNWQRTKLGVSSAEYWGTKGDGKGLLKSTVKFGLKQPQ